MRQTNSAISMLLAQYRAVYRKAYYIGMATAYILGTVFIATPSYAAEVPNTGILDNATYKPTQKLELNSKKLTQDNNKNTVIDLSAFPNDKFEVVTSGADINGTLTLKGNTAQNGKRLKLDLNGDPKKRGVLAGNGTGKLVLQDNVEFNVLYGDARIDTFSSIEANNKSSLNFGDGSHGYITQDQLENFLTGKGQQANQGKIQLFNNKNAQTELNPTLTITQKDNESIVLSKYVGASGTGKLSGLGNIETKSAIIEHGVFDHSNGLNLTTEKLVIGTDVAETKIDQVGFSHIKVTDDLEFKSNTDSVLYKEQVIELNATDDKTHKVHSDKKNVILGFKDDLQFVDGTWDLDTSLEVRSGQLSVKGQNKDTTTVVLTKDNKLSFATDAQNATGKIVVGGTDSKGSAVLDIKDATVNENAHSNLEVKERGTLKSSADNFKKLTKGKIVLESGANPTTDEATIEIVGGELTLVEDDFSDVHFTNKGTLKGQSLIIDESSADNDTNINLTKNQTGFDKDKTKFEFNDIKFNANEATLESAIVSVNNNLAVTKDNNKGTLVLKEDATLNLNGNATTQSKVDAKHIDIQKGTLNVEGTWDFQDADLYLANANSATALNVKKDASLNKINTLKINDGKANVIGGNVYTNKLEVNGNSSLDLSNGANVTIVGTDGSDDLKIVDTASIKSTTGSHFIVKDKAASDIYDAKTKTFSTEGNKFAEKYSADASTTLELQYSQDTFIDKDEAKKVIDKFTNNDGFISFGDAQIGLPDIKDNTITWDDAKFYGKLQITNKELQQVKVTGDKDQIEKDKGIYGSFGSFEIKDTNQNSDYTVNVHGNTILSNASGNGDKSSFVTVNDKKANLNIAKDITLTLENGGSIGDISLDENSRFVIVNNNNTTTNVNAITTKDKNKNNTVDFASGTVNIENGIDVVNLALKDNTLNVKQDLVAKSLNAKNSNLNVDGKITLGDEKKISFSTFDGSNVKTTSFDLKNHTLDLHDTSVYAKSINADKTSSINIGSKAPAIEPIDNKDVIPALPINPIEPKLGSSGRLFVEDANSLNATVNLEAGNSRASALVLGKNKNSINEIKSNVNVGANSVVAYGFDSADDLEKHLQDNFLQKANGSIDGNKALAVFNDVTKITDGKLTLNGVANPLDDRANTQTATEGIVLGDNTSIVITDNALAAAKASKSNKGIIQATNGKITLDPNGSKNVEIVLTGNITANSLKDDFGNDIVLLGEGISIEGANEIKVVAANGMLTGTLKDGKVVDLKANVDAINRENYNTSTPVKEYIAKVLNDSNVKVNINDYLGNHGKDLEQASRFGLYGGALKASEIASRAQGDVLKGYIASSMAISAEHGELSSFFIKPHVVSSKNKELEAEGQVYGNDINLYGATFGSGFSVTPNIKVGALASLGRGSAKGRDIASGIDNDFTYYGVGAFASFIRPNFSTTADVNYSHVKSDLNSELTNSNIRHFNANVDSSVLSMGLESAYSFKYKGLEFSPHGGIRYSQYKLSDYNVYADNNNFMSNKFNDMSVLSLPFGLSVGADLVNDVWVVRPNLDLGITFNLGDTKMEQVSNIVGVNPTMTLNTQVVDDVVLGVKAGLRAYSGNLAIGFDIGYQGSSNASDISLGADVNYLF